MLNDAHGVLIEVEGSPASVDRFLARLPSEAPPLAVVERVVSDELAPGGDGSFAIRESVGGTIPDAPVTPDTATCAGLPARAVRPRRPPLPLPVHQLHELRSAVHDRARRAVRPAVDDDGRLHDVPALPGRVREPSRPALPRPAERLPSVRTVGPAARTAPAPAIPSPLPWPRSPAARSSRSRASVAITWPAAPTTSGRWRRCGRASTARTSRSR